MSQAHVRKEACKPTNTHLAKVLSPAGRVRGVLRFPEALKGRPGRPRIRSVLRGRASGPRDIRDLGEPWDLRRTWAERGGADTLGWGPARGAEPLQPTPGGGAPDTTPPARPAVRPRTAHRGPRAGHPGSSPAGLGGDMEDLRDGAEAERGQPGIPAGKGHRSRGWTQARGRLKWGRGAGSGVQSRRPPGVSCVQRKGGGDTPSAPSFSPLPRGALGPRLPPIVQSGKLKSTARWPRPSADISARWPGPAPPPIPWAPGAKPLEGRHRSRQSRLGSGRHRRVSRTVPTPASPGEGPRGRFPPPAPTGRARALPADRKSVV